MSLIRKQQTSSKGNIKSSSVNGIADTSNITKLNTPVMGSNSSSNNASSSRSQQQQQQQQPQQQQQHHPTATVSTYPNASIMGSTSLPNSVSQSSSATSNINSLAPLNSVTLITTTTTSGISNNNANNASVLNSKKSIVLPSANLTHLSSTTVTSSNITSHAHINATPLILPSLSSSNNNTSNKSISGSSTPLIRPIITNPITNYPNLNMNVNNPSTVSLLNSNVIEIQNKLNDCKSILESEKSLLKPNINAQITSADEKSNSSTNVNRKLAKTKKQLNK
jgi:hypothetical protein